MDICKNNEIIFQVGIRKSNQDEDVIFLYKFRNESNLIITIFYNFLIILFFNDNIKFKECVVVLEQIPIKNIEKLDNSENNYLIDKNFINSVLDNFDIEALIVSMLDNFDIESLIVDLIKNVNLNKF